MNQSEHNHLSLDGRPFVLYQGLFLTDNPLKTRSIPPQRPGQEHRALRAVQQVHQVGPVWEPAFGPCWGVTVAALAAFYDSLVR